MVRVVSWVDRSNGRQASWSGWTCLVRAVSRSTTQRILVISRSEWLVEQLSMVSSPDSELCSRHRAAAASGKSMAFSEHVTLGPIAHNSSPSQIQRVSSPDRLFIVRRPKVGGTASRLVKPEPSPGTSINCVPDTITAHWWSVLIYLTS